MAKKFCEVSLVAGREKTILSGFQTQTLKLSERGTYNMGFTPLSTTLSLTNFKPQSI